jgi:uncharacterized protein (TIGR02391 family)
MPRKPSRPDPKPPTISLEEGKRRLTTMRDKADALLASRPLSEQAVQTWGNQTVEYIKQTFGEDSSHLGTFYGNITISFDDGSGYDHYAEERDAVKLRERRAALDSILEALETDIQFSGPTQPKAVDDFWHRLHPTVTHVARSLFESKHYADAVLASLRELNSKIKSSAKKATGNEFDGADLMQRAFSPINPIFRLGDLSTEDGKNIQQGYMQIFAGAMIAIRNPKSHSNVAIDADRAIHLLHLASLLHYIFDERI